MNSNSRLLRLGKYPFLSCLSVCPKQLIGDIQSYDVYGVRPRARKPSAPRSHRQISPGETAIQSLEI